MRGAVLYGPRDIRFEDRPEPTIIEPTDALIMTHIAIDVCLLGAWIRVPVALDGYAWSGRHGRWPILFEAECMPSMTGSEFIGQVEASCHRHSGV